MQIPLYCNIICYPIVNNNNKQIRELQILCHDKYAQNNNNHSIDIQELAERHGVFESVSSWSPDHIYLISNG